MRALEKNKIKALEAVLAEQKLTQAIVFCNRKREVNDVYKDLQKNGFKVAAFHGDLTQSDRNKTLKAFKEGEIDFLIASDVAARGIDVEDLPAVINFHVPSNPEDYTHRIGRTGRAGKPGKAFTLVSPPEEKYLSLIVKSVDKAIEEYVIKQQEATPVKEERTVRAKPSPQPRRSTPAPEPRIQKKQPSPSKAKPAKSSPPTDNVVGFGDHIPPFMRTKDRET